MPVLSPNRSEKTTKKALIEPVYKKMAMIDLSSQRESGPGQMENSQATTFSAAIISTSGFDSSIRETRPLFFRTIRE